MKELTNEDIKRVMGYAKTTKNPERDQVILALSIKAGMTTTEIAHLKVNDVISNEGCIKDEVKTGKRVVLLNTETQRLIEAYLTVRFSRSLVDIAHLNKLMSGHIYPLHLLENQKRGYFDEWTLPTVLQTLYKSAGVNKPPSVGRVTYIKRLAKSGLSMRQMTELSGMTAESVARYLDEENKDVRAILEQM